MKRWEMDATMEPAECGAWVSGDEAEAEIRRQERTITACYTTQKRMDDDNKRLRHKVARYIEEARRYRRQYDIMAEGLTTLKDDLQQAHEILDLYASQFTYDIELPEVVKGGQDDQT